MEYRRTMMKLANIELNLHSSYNRAHNSENDADYAAMLDNMQAENKSHKTYAVDFINTIESRDLYDLNLQEYNQQQRDTAGFEDLFDTEYLFSHPTADVNELKHFQQYV